MLVLRAGRETNPLPPLRQVRGWGSQAETTRETTGKACRWNTLGPQGSRKRGPLQRPCHSCGKQGRSCVGGAVGTGSGEGGGGTSRGRKGGEGEGSPLVSSFLSFVISFVIFCFLLPLAGSRSRRTESTATTAPNHMALRTVTGFSHSVIYKPKTSCSHDPVGSNAEI